MAEYTPPTGYEPKLLDDFHYSETTEMIFQEESGDKDTEPSYLCDAELDDETIGKALSSPLFTQERGESADRRQAYHSHEESLLPAQSFFTHTQERGDPCTNLVRADNNQVAKWKNETIRIPLERQREQILADFGAEIQKHEFQAESDWRSIQELIILLQVMNNFDEINCFSMNNYQNKIVIFVMRRVNEMEKLKRFQGSTLDGFSRRKLVENQDTVHELTARIQELKNDVDCLNDSRDF